MIPSPPDLQENQRHDLTGEGEVLPDVDDGKSRHADRGGGGKRASVKLRWPRPAANGSRSRIAPARITSAKLRIKIRGGVKRREIDLRIRKRISMPSTRKVPLPTGPGDFPLQFTSVRSFRLRRRTAIRTPAPTVIAESATLKAGQW